MNKAHDRVVINNLERILNRDINLLQSQADQLVRYLQEQQYGVRAAAGDFRRGTPPNGFINDGFVVLPSEPLAGSVRIQAGYGLQYAAGDVPQDITGFLTGTLRVNDLPPYKPIVLTANETIALDPPPAAPDSRIDLIEVRYDRFASDASSRDILDVATRKAVTTPNVFKTLSFALDGRKGRVLAGNPSTQPIGYKVGVPAGAPTAPSATSGYIPIATILVRNLTDNPDGNIDADMITDLRPPLLCGGAQEVAVWVRVNNVAIGAPTIQSLIAPPGCRVSVVSTDTIGAKVNLFISMGNLASTGSLIYNAQVSAYLGDHLFDVRDSLNAGALSSSDQASIVSGLSAPTFKIAVGQPVFKVRLRAVTQIGAVTTETMIGATTDYRFKGLLSR